MTPATFMVSADVLPISMKTDILRPKAAMALARNMGMLMFTCDQQSSSSEVTACPSIKEISIAAKSWTAINAQ